MRRGFASLIMGLSLTIGSMAWAGFAFSSTVLNPEISATLAQRLLTNEQLHGVLLSRTADALEAQIPESAPTPRQTVEAAAERLLADEAASAAMEDALIEVHQRALGGDDSAVVASTEGLDAAGRAALVETRPELESLLPDDTSIPVVVPSSGLAWLGGLKSSLDRYVMMGAAMATAGLVLAFAVSTDRAGVLRRTALWAFWTAAFWLLVGFGVPALVGYALPPSFAVLGAIASLVSVAMKGPATLLAAFGVGLLALSYVMPAVDRRRGGAMLSPRQPSPADYQPMAPATAAGRAVRATPVTPAVSEPANPEPAPSRATLVEPALHDTVKVAAVAPAPIEDRRSPVEPVWIEGYGYLDDARVAPFFRAGPEAEPDEQEFADLWPAAWQFSE